LPAVEAARRDRFAALVSFARQHSSFYRKAYSRLPTNLSTYDVLPVVTKRELMARFDDWVTDPEIRRRDIDVFLADRTHIGDRYLGQFLKGGRAALVAATGDHFASIASWERVCRSGPGVAARGFSIMEPLGRLVAELNAFAPAYLASYPTMLTVLAAERVAGRLRVTPTIIWSGGEFLAPGARADLARAFDCPVLNEYGSWLIRAAGSCDRSWLSRTRNRHDDPNGAPTPKSSSRASMFRFARNNHCTPTRGPAPRGGP
jgi:hypothetical protein